MRNFILGLIVGLVVMGLVSLIMIKEDQQKSVENENSAKDIGMGVVTSTETTSTEVTSMLRTFYIHDFSSALPAMISEVASSGEYLVADIVDRNPKWLPGGSEPFYLNKEVKKEKLFVTDQTESYTCGAGVDGNDTSPDVYVKTSDYIQSIRDYLTKEKESAQRGYAGHSESPIYSSGVIISEGAVLVMYNQCLP